MKTFVSRQYLWVLAFSLTSLVQIGNSIAAGQSSVPAELRVFNWQWELTFGPWFLVALYRHIEQNYTPNSLLRLGSSWKFATEWYVRVAFPWILSVGVASFAIGYLGIRLHPIYFFTRPSAIVGSCTDPACHPLLMTGWELFSQQFVAFALVLFAFTLLGTLAASRHWTGEKLFLLVLALVAMRTLSGISAWVQAGDVVMWFNGWWYEPDWGYSLSHVRYFTVAFLSILIAYLASLLLLEARPKFQRILASATTLLVASWLLQTLSGSQQTMGRAFAFVFNPSHAAIDAPLRVLLWFLIFYVAAALLRGTRVWFTISAPLVIVLWLFGFLIAHGEVRGLNLTTFVGITIVLLAISITYLLGEKAGARLCLVSGFATLILFPFIPSALLITTVASAGFLLWKQRKALKSD